MFPSKDVAQNGKLPMLVLESTKKTFDDQYGVTVNNGDYQIQDMKFDCASSSPNSITKSFNFMVKISDNKSVFPEALSRSLSETTTEL
ncbi:hypothetical protein, partial [Acinetobacter baumannii]|uniref:hypothetical protein n=1 Tax=Acinetobacter baumannii TaxID=470 RepID=UPI001C07162D